MKRSPRFDQQSGERSSTTFLALHNFQEKIKWRRSCFYEKLSHSQRKNRGYDKCFRTKGFWFRGKNPSSTPIYSWSRWFPWHLL